MLSIEEGADIVIHRWCRVKPDEKVLIITDDTHQQEGLALWRAVQRAGGAVSMVTIPESSSQPGHLFDTMLEFFLYNDVIIGATNFSLITTRAGRAERGQHVGSKKRLPLKPIPARRAMLIYFRKDTKHSFRYRV